MCGCRCECSPLPPTSLHFTWHRIKKKSPWKHQWEFFPFFLSFHWFIHSFIIFVLCIPPYSWSFFSFCFSLSSIFSSVQSLIPSLFLFFFVFLSSAPSLPSLLPHVQHSSLLPQRCSPGEAEVQGEKPASSVKQLCGMWLRVLCYFVFFSQANKINVVLNILHAKQVTLSALYNGICIYKPNTLVKNEEKAPRMKRNVDLAPD